MILTGWIAEYHAQGMEYETWLIFQDRTYAESRDRGWQLDGMHRLCLGQTLTILDANGEILWSGTLQPKRIGFLKLWKITPDHPQWAPDGVELNQWLSWFQHQPPLDARLQTS